MSREIVIKWREKRTLIVARRTLTVPKTALAGVVFEASFARFRTSMAAFNEDVTLSLPFDFEDFGAIAGLCVSWEAVRKGGI